MNPKSTKIIERIQEVIQLSEKVLDSKGSNNYGAWIEDKAILNEWLIKSTNIMKIAFGENGLHFTEFRKKLELGVNTPIEVECLKGILNGALDDFKGGFIIGQEFLIAGEIFDSVLEEGKHLLETSHKDAAAVLGRVILEDALKRIARRENLDDCTKASKINDELKKESIYSQPQWRLIQAWLDIGNSAAHGNFDNYTYSDVSNMYIGIEQFLASHF